MRRRMVADLTVVRLSTLTRQATRFLEAAVVSGLNILVAWRHPGRQAELRQVAPHMTVVSKVRK